MTSGESDSATLLRLVDGLAEAMERGFNMLRSEIGSLRSEIGSVRSELRSEVGSVRTELRSEIGKLRHDMNRRFDRVDERFDSFDRRVTVLEAASHTHPDD